MGQQVTVKAAGLFLAPNDLGSVPDGAMAQADNVVISRDGITEQRRGMESVSAKVLNRLFTFKTYLVGWAASTGILSRSSDQGVTWSDYPGTYPRPTAKVRSAESSGNLYFTTATGIHRLDTFTGTPEPAGVPNGLDVQTSLTASSGTAVPVDTQVAYRMVWGKRDANGNLLLGSPTGRSVITNPKSYVVPIGGMVRVGTTVTVTLPAGATNVLQPDNLVTLSPGEANFATGIKTVTAVTSTTFTYSEAGSASSSTVAQTFVGQARDITVTGSIPQNLPTGAFYQVYRSPNSSSETVTPGDELGLVYEGTPPGVSTLSGLSRTGSTVTATTTAAHGYAAGTIVRLASSVTSGAELVVAVGTNSCATSPDGVTWTSRTIPAGTWRGVSSNGSVLCAVSNSTAGVGGAATSTDGVTWTTRDMPGTNAWNAIAWNGTVFCAVGSSSACATSPDGIAWTSRTISAASYNTIAWNGTVFAALGVCDGVFNVSANTYGVATSTDGTTWTNRTLSKVQQYTGALVFAGPMTFTAACVNGTRFMAAGLESGIVPIIFSSPDGITWSGYGQAIVSYLDTVGGLASNGSTFLLTGHETATNYLVSGSPSGASVWSAQRKDPLTMTPTASLWNGSQYIAVGSGKAATSPDGGTWTDRTIPSGGYLAITSSGVSFSSGDKTIVSVPLSTTFTYAEAGNAGSLSSSQTITPLTCSFTDNVPSGFIGAALYTNPNQGTITASADRVSLCQDIATFRGFLFAANITYPSKASFYLLSVGGTGGLTFGDSITIDGYTYTADASQESTGGRTFVAYTTGTPSQNIANTAQSLIRVINRSSSNSITARYLSGADDVPGLIYVEEAGTSTTMTLTFSKPTVWSVQSQKGPENRKNEIRWSSNGQPDAMPLVNFAAIGSLDKPVQRIMATRDMLVIVKDDGIWRLTGWNGIWDIQPLDPTMGTPESESLVPFENAMFGLLDSGVARATESGVEMISTPIYPAIEQLLAPAVAATLEAVGFGIAYHSSHKYILWLPASSTDTVATQAYVYDSWTNAWTRWTPPIGVTGWAHGLINPADDRCYMVDGAHVYRERKAMDDTDLQDAAGGSIAHTIKYTPKFGGNPGQLHRFQEVSFLFRRVKFSTAEVGFSTNLSPDEEVIELDGANYGIDITPGAQTTIRVLVPRQMSRASQLNIRFTHGEPGSPCQLQGISVIHRPGSARVSR